MANLRTTVLIVGSGPTGGALGVLLGRLGVPATIVTRAAWVSDTPRAHITNQRTMEIMRAVGLEAACRRQATGNALMANLPMLTAIAGEEFGRLWTWGNDPSRVSDYLSASPCEMCDVPQSRLEPILLGEAARVGCRLLFSHLLEDFADLGDGVTATVRDLVSGETHEVHADYLVGADGGQSMVAERLGLPMEGTSGLANAINVRCTADLERYVAKRPGSLFWVLQPDRPSGLGNAMFRMVRPWDQWVVGFSYVDTDAGELTPERARQLIVELVGDEQIEVTIDEISLWRIHHLIAGRYSDGRVLCAGDAVHRHPPMNGLGANTCIQDAFNLAWKLAFVTRGVAAPALLDTYTAERQPVGRAIVDRAIDSWRQVPELVAALGVDPGAPAHERQAAFADFHADTETGARRRAAFLDVCRSRAYTYHAHGVELNQIYRSPAVIADGPVPDPPRDPQLFYWPTLTPGARLPHCWVGPPLAPVSTLDLARPDRFTLLTGRGGERWRTIAEEVGDRLGAPVATVTIGAGGDHADLYGDWAALTEEDETGCVLVRPDQHIAWRCNTAPAQPRETLEAHLRTILGR